MRTKKTMLLMHLFTFKHCGQIKLGRGVIFVFLLSLMLNSCQKEKLDDSSCQFELDEERIAAVNEISLIFHEEFEATIYKTQIGSDQYAEKFAKTLSENLDIRIKNLKIDHSLKSTNLEGDSINIKSQLYFDELSDLIIQNEFDENADKETVLININNTVDNYIEWIKIDEKLTNIEK